MRNRAECRPDERTAIATDVLSDVFRNIRLAGALYFDVNAGAPWMAETRQAAALCPRVLRGFEHVISLYVVLKGSCWAQLCDESQPAVRLDVADGVIFWHGDAHSMSSEPRERLSSKSGLRGRSPDDALPFALYESGSGERARFVCGYLDCDARPYNPILGALPRVLHVPGSSAAGALTFDLMSAAVAESRQPRAGAEAILSKLGELMLLQAVRHCIECLPAESTGWLAALRDSNVSAALRALHGRPAEPWTLDALAREAGLSRSMFCERFSGLMGTSAMQYLSNWRLQLASSLLERRGASITRIAADVGYESDAAFNRAFKKRVGVPPGAWRRRRRGRTPVDDGHASEEVAGC